MGRSPAAERRELSTNTEHDLTACLEGLPSRLPFGLVIRRLLGDQMLATQRFAAGFANRTEARRLAAGAVGKVHGPTFLWRFDPGLTPGAQRQQHRVEGFSLIGQMILVTQRMLVIDAAPH